MQEIVRQKVESAQSERAKKGDIMNKDTAKKQIRLALQPDLNTNDVNMALLMQDEVELDRMRTAVKYLRHKADAYCEEIDRCECEDEIMKIVGSVTRT